jgi:hypothetical protein
MAGNEMGVDREGVRDKREEERQQEREWDRFRSRVLRPRRDTAEMVLRRLARQADAHRKDEGEEDVTTEA